MWVSSISYGPIFGGRNAGLLAFVLDFTGDPPAEGEAAETLLKIRSFKAADYKWLYLRGKFPKEEIWLHSFCKAARDSGFWIFVETDGQLWRPWFGIDCVNHLIVINDGRPWMQFRCQELRFLWDGEAAPPEPIPELQTTQYVLVPPEGVSAEKVLEFLRKAKGSWSLSLRPKNAFRVQLS
jgi:hypothetical protein